MCINKWTGTKKFIQANVLSVKFHFSNVYHLSSLVLIYIIHYILGCSLLRLIFLYFLCNFWKFFWCYIIEKLKFVILKIIYKVRIPLDFEINTFLNGYDQNILIYILNFNSFLKSVIHAGKILKPRAMSAHF